MLHMLLVLRYAGVASRVLINLTYSYDLSLLAVLFRFKVITITVLL